MEDLIKKYPNIHHLPRGGYLIPSSAGVIQVGSPVETIKDTMQLEAGVPRIFVLPRDFFNWSKGINVADLEFPVYYNFFLRQQKTIIICTHNQAIRMKKALQEAVFGPKDLDVSGDFAPGLPLPDLKKELSYFKNFKFSDLLGFGLLNEDNNFTVSGVTIQLADSGNFEFHEKGEKIAEVPGNVKYTPKYTMGKRLPEPYHPPLFGLTSLGRSHGFDPTENSSGFLLWVHHNGIMIDPPVNSTEWLKQSNVNPKYIDSIILTHCHADHDAGTFQKILEEGKVRIYTTKTIMDSFIRKYSALTDIPENDLRRLFNFSPITIGKPVFIHGARFDMRYSLHSIPTIAFDVTFQHFTFAFSSDHFNTPDIHQKLREEGIISQGRYEELSQFNWSADMIFHEAGIPPIHTPLNYLVTLPEHVRKKMQVYHISEKDFNDNPNLSYVNCGIENTLYFEVSPPDFEESYQILDLLKHLDFSENFPITKAQEFVSLIQKEEFKKGELIIQKGTTGKKFYIIQSGNVSVKGDDENIYKVYGAYEYFGEVALITDQMRTADVYAETDVVVYTMDKPKFLNFISGTEFEQTLFRLVQNRSQETWSVLSASHFTHHMTSYQKTWIESILFSVKIPGEGTLIEEGGAIEQVYIIRTGKVKVFSSGKHLATLERGDFIGSLKSIYYNSPSEYTFLHEEGVTLFAINRDEVLPFIRKNPGLAMKMRYDF